MNDFQKYWRDKVTNLLQWGAALFILFVGWSIQYHEMFELRGVSWPENQDQMVATSGLLIVTVIYAPLLPLAVRYIYKHHLSNDVDKTVLPYRFALACSVVLSGFTLAVAVLMSYF